MDVVKELTRITQAVSLASSAKEQVKIIVDEISHCLEVDVCSLYVQSPEGDMVLLATHGLLADRPVRIPKGKGLVGLVVSSRHTINLADGIKHPDYFHVKDITEEKYKSFCGAPMVSQGDVVGVLVVQSQKAEPLNEKQEAFVATLAAHIALIVKNMPVADAPGASSLALKGVGASDGVAIGTPQFCMKARLADVPVSHHEDVEKELYRWRVLLEKVAAELDAEKAMLGADVSAEIKEVFDAYKMLLMDKSLCDRVEDGIRETLSLLTALKQGIQHFSDLFSKIDDPYLKARSEDIWHIGNKLFQSYIADQATSDKPASGHADIILMGHDVSVSDIAMCPTKRLKGIVCKAGGRLSHSAIVANALGIPAVMGVERLFDQSDIRQVIIDGTEGKVFINPSKPLTREYLNVVSKQNAEIKELAQYKNIPAKTLNGSHIQLFANSGLLSDISPGLKNGAEGIGLFRTEIVFMTRDSFPTEEEQIEIYQRVFEQYKGKPVYMRTLDIGSDKQLPYFPILGEENPAMGWRGVRFTLDNVQILMTQLRAMLRAAGDTGQLHIIVPMVCSTNELEAFHGVLSDALAQLSSEGLACEKPKVGVMVEVPAAISQLKFWAPYIDFVSIGTNDLSQYILALDRNNAKVAPRFDLIHPAVVHEVKRAIDEAEKWKLPVCVCGEMAGSPIAVLLLLAMGVTRLSVSSAKIPRLKALILKLDERDCQRFLAQALEQSSAQSIRLIGDALLHTVFPSSTGLSPGPGLPSREGAATETATGSLE